MKKQKKEKGITLIALVVTIIVLLILAGVTIAMVLGQNGIFNKAETAAERTNESQELEQVRLAVLEAKTNYITRDKSKTFKEELEESINKVYPESNVTDNGDNTYTITLPNGHQYIVDGSGNTTRGEDIEKLPEKWKDIYFLNDDNMLLALDVDSNCWIWGGNGSFTETKPIKVEIPEEVELLEVNGTVPYFLSKDKKRIYGVVIQNDKINLQKISFSEDIQIKKTSILFTLDTDGKIWVMQGGDEEKGVLNIVPIETLVPDLADTIFSDIDTMFATTNDGKVINLMTMEEEKLLEGKQIKYKTTGRRTYILTNTGEVFQPSNSYAIEKVEIPYLIKDMSSDLYLTQDNRIFDKFLEEIAIDFEPVKLLGKSMVEDENGNVYVFVDDEWKLTIENTSGAPWNKIKSTSYNGIAIIDNNQHLQLYGGLGGEPS